MLEPILLKQTFKQGGVDVRSFFLIVLYVLFVHVFGCFCIVGYFNTYNHTKKIKNCLL